MNSNYVYIGQGIAVDLEDARDYIRDGYLLTPRTVLKGLTKSAPPVLPSVSIDVDKVSLQVQRELEARLGQIAGFDQAVMFSGGFDSMLMVRLAQHCGAKVQAFTVQFEDLNPRTVQNAIESAESLRIKHHILPVKIVEFLSAFEALADITSEPILDLDLALVYAALKKYDSKIAGDTFISGMGSDQWLGNEAVKSDQSSFAKHLDWALVDEDAHQAVAKVFGCKFVFPFLSKPMLALSQSILDVLKKDKKLLRELSITDSIPHRENVNEEQVPPLICNLVIKTYGHRAWPQPISEHNNDTDNQKLRQISLGLWLEKVERIDKFN